MHGIERFVPRVCYPEVKDCRTSCCQGAVRVVARSLCANVWGASPHGPREYGSGAKDNASWRLSRCKGTRRPSRNVKLPSSWRLMIMLSWTRGGGSTATIWLRRALKGRVLPARSASILLRVEWLASTTALSTVGWKMRASSTYVDFRFSSIVELRHRPGPRRSRRMCEDAGFTVVRKGCQNMHFRPEQETDKRRCFVLEYKSLTWPRSGYGYLPSEPDNYVKYIRTRMQLSYLTKFLTSTTDSTIRASEGRRLLCLSQKLDTQHPLQHHEPPPEPMKQWFCNGSWCTEVQFWWEAQ